MIDRFEVSYEVQGKKYTDECPTLYKAALKAKELLNEPYLNYRRFGGEGLTITHNQYASEEQQRQHFTKTSLFPKSEICFVCKVHPVILSLK